MLLNMLQVYQTSTIGYFASTLRGFLIFSTGSRRFWHIFEDSRWTFRVKLQLLEPFRPDWLFSAISFKFLKRFQVTLDEFFMITIYLITEKWPVIRSEALRSTHRRFDASLFQNREPIHGTLQVNSKHVPIEFIEAENWIFGNVLKANSSFNNDLMQLFQRFN